MADFSGLVGKVFTATQISRGTIQTGGSAGYQYTEANALADQSAIVGTYGADATITFLTVTTGNFISFTARLVSSSIFVGTQTISGTFLANGATDFVLNAQGLPGLGSAFLYVTNTVAQQPGPGQSVTVPDVLSNVTYTPPACFAKGTLIETARGPVAVESLSVGDIVLTHHIGTEDAPRARPIIWIGQRTVKCIRHPDPGSVLPIRIQADAFGVGLPRRDLYLSPDHAIYLDGMLIPVKYLLTNDTIAQVQVEEVTYYHIELSYHDILLAEGLPVESYLETGDRDNFDTNGEVLRLFPAFSDTRRTGFAWESQAFAPLTIVGPEIEAIRARLADRADSLGQEITPPLQHHTHR